jgi:omega-6 fatty acid desaturase (delta-12 desaturase)
MALAPASESIAKVKAHVPEHLRSRSSAIGLLLFGFSALLYVATFALALWPLPLWLRCLASLANATFIATLFIVGHDACHGSLTPKPWLNKLLGRLSFLASWHPYVSWDLGHNRIHHSWTNLKGRDYVWTPLSIQEFLDLPPSGRFLQRFYRSLPGVGFYYLYEIWFKHMVFPRASDRKRMSPSLLAADRLSVALFVIVQMTVSVIAAAHFQTSLWLAIGLAVVLPQLLWNQLMGLVILLHHTHPRVRWFDDPEKWSFFNGQIRGTVHVKFPWPIGTILHHIMDHTAHHVDTRIPLYHLPEAQVAMESSYPSDVIVSPFSWTNLQNVLHHCQLYDYSQHQWLRFAQATEPDTAAHSHQTETLTLEEASDHLHIPLSQLCQMVENGHLDAVRTGGRWHIDPTALAQVDAKIRSSTPQLKVLVIDDDPAIQALFRQFLSHLGLEHLEAVSGAAALTVLKAQRVDLAFLDLKLADSSGDQVFAQIQSIHPGLPTAVITGYPDSEILSRILIHGPVIVIKKPLDLKQLGLAVQQLSGATPRKNSSLFAHTAETVAVS